MTVTLTVNYKEVLAAATVEKIDELLEDSYELTDILVFIDEHNEEDFVAYYEEYVAQGENLGYDVADKFIGEFGVDCIEYCQETYQGSYNSEAEFAEEYTQDVYGDIPSYLVVDWQATWDSNLSYDYVFVDGFVFTKNF